MGSLFTEIGRIARETLLDAVRVASILGLLWFGRLLIQAITSAEDHQALEFVHYWGSVALLAGVAAHAVMRILFEILISGKLKLGELRNAQFTGQPPQPTGDAAPTSQPEPEPAAATTQSERAEFVREVMKRISANGPRSPRE